MIGVKTGTQSHEKFSYKVQCKSCVAYYSVNYSNANYSGSEIINVTI